MYGKSSPWVKTKIINDTILDIQNPRYLFKDPFDEVYVIEQRYNNRPDLFSYDRYGTSKYWWVFAQRNVDIIKDPIFDFTTGKTIRVPKFENLEKMS